MTDRPLTPAEAAAMFEATDAAQLADEQRKSHACDLCDAVKPTAYALRDHTLNVHPDQFEAWRDRRRSDEPADVEELLAHLRQRIASNVSLAALDGRNALAYVVIRPDAGEDNVTVEAAANGMDKQAAAYVLRHVADTFDAEAQAAGEEPFTEDELTDAAARTARRYADALRIVAEFQAEANDVGGIDINDLADRLTSAGHGLPNVEEQGR